MTLLNDWTLFEKIWLATAVAIMSGLSLYWQDTFIGFIASVTGVICVVLVAKGKISSYLFGIINAATYGYVAYQYGLYGESDLNWFIYLPLQFVGLYLWYRNSQKRKELHASSVNGENVEIRRLQRKQWVYLLGVIAVVYMLYAQLLSYRGANLAGLDGFAVVLSIVAQLLLMLRYVEQWLLWIVVNVITIALWFIVLLQSNGNDWSVFTMWCAFLVNSIYGYYNWLKISKGAER